MKEITNMAKSLLRGEIFKKNGIDSAENMSKLVVKAFDEGETIIDPAFKGLKKQLTLEDGTKIKFSFEKVDDLYELKTVTPTVKKDVIGDKIHELKNKAIELGNKNLE